MCKKVEGLLKTLEDTEIGNSDVDVGSICKELNRLSLNDTDLFRVARILVKNRKWDMMLFLIVGILFFYFLLSVAISFVVSSVYFILLIILPSFFAMSITLTLLLAIVSSIQYRSGL